MDPFDATHLLRDSRVGDGHAPDGLFDHIHEELRRIADERTGPGALSATGPAV